MTAPTRDRRHGDPHLRRGGTYSVTLTVTDTNGGTGTVTQPVTVTGPVNDAPTASFTHTESFLKVDVNAGASSDPDGTIAGLRLELW